jgi:hypothetical protein
MRIRNAVTSAKKINPIEIMRNLKSPASSSYISSAKKALAQEEYNEIDNIKFVLSGKKNDQQLKSFNDKENIRNNNIVIDRFGKASSKEDDNDDLKNYVNVTKLQMEVQDYNLLESPERSHHKHSKSRSRTKEKRGNHSDGNPDTYDIYQADTYQQFDDKTSMMIDFDSSPSPTKPAQSLPSLEETSKSLEWILDKNIDKQKRDEICKIIGEEESRNTLHIDHLSSASDRPAQEIEVEEVSHVKFGNSAIKAENVGEADNLGHYVE